MLIHTTHGGYSPHPPCPSAYTHLAPQATPILPLSPHPFRPSAHTHFAPQPTPTLPLRAYTHFAPQPTPISPLSPHPFCPSAHTHLAPQPTPISPLSPHPFSPSAYTHLAPQSLHPFCPLASSLPPRLHSPSPLCLNRGRQRGGMTKRGLSCSRWTPRC